MYMQWQTPEIVIPKPSKAVPVMFVDQRHSKEFLTANGLAKEICITVVIDRHALAAHEFWHRKTEGRWVDHPPARKKTHADEHFADHFGVSGRLLQLRREMPNAAPQPNLAVPGAVFLTIVFAALETVAEVDFAVVELSHTEFEVRILDERRFHRAPPELPAGSKVPSRRELAKFQQPLLGTKDEVGRVRTIDIVGGRTASDYRTLATHQFDPEERWKREQQFQGRLAQQQAAFRARC
eukprot:TRINITY_DN5845_c1_g1_i1.p1 TRINITY_DN5845_c1_g1~~TRINITY_DN5845_c1_g1_i1.p1  ORF type:complete len:245 (+),score=46.80 TRINITY_DN5845_c1_g1_i1:22-735(+)